MKSKEVKGKNWMLKWEIMYRPEQEETINKFMEFCRLHGYNRVAGLHTLLDRADYHKHLLIMADKILDVNKELASIRELIEKPVEEEEEVESPKTLGNQ